MRATYLRKVKFKNFQDLNFIIYDIIMKNAMVIFLGDGRMQKKHMELILVS